MPQLIVREQGNEKLFDIVHDVTTIGRSSKCTITITDKTASRIHCEILKTPEGYLLRDKGSRNGTLVNGKRSGEIFLSVGDVIEIGHTVIFFEREKATRFGRFSVTGDTTLRKVERAYTKPIRMEAADQAHPITADQLESLAMDADPYEFDVVARARHAAPHRIIVVTTLLLIIVLLSALLIFLQTPRRYQQEDQDITSAGNLLSDNPSFETKSQAENEIKGWNSSGPASAKISTDVSRTGLHSLVLSLPDRETSTTPSFSATTSFRKIPISRGMIYRLTGWAKVADIRGCTGLKITWFKNEAEPLCSSPTNLLSEPTATWESLEANIEPPANASHAQVSCFLLAYSGHVFFDDISLTARPAPEFSWAASASSPRLSFSSDSHGLIEISCPEKKWVLRTGPPSLTNLECIEMSAPIYFPLQRDVSSLPLETSLLGRILNPSTFDLMEFEQNIRAIEKGASISYFIEGTVRAAMTLKFEPAAISSGINLETTSLPLIHDPEPFSVEGVLTMSFLTGNRMLSFTYSEPVTLNVTKDRSYLLFSHISADNALEITIEYEEAPIPAEIRNKLAEVRRAMLDNKFGAAINLMREIVADPHAPAELKEEMRQMELRAEAQLAWAADAFKSGKELRSQDILSRARRLCDSIAKDYEGTDFATRATALIEDIDEAVWNIDIASQEQEAERLWKVVQKYHSEGKLELACLFCSEILRRFPRSSIVSQARTLLSKLQEEKRRE